MSASKPGASLPFLLPTPQARVATLVAAANASPVLNPQAGEQDDSVRQHVVRLARTDPGVRAAHHADTPGCWPTDSSSGRFTESGRDPNAPTDLADTRLPSGYWIGERAATDVLALALALAAKGRAFRSLDTLTVQQGGHHLLYASALAASGLAGPARPAPNSPS